jgi:hypothetical protein
MRRVIESERGKLMFKLFLLVLLGVAFLVTSPLTSSRQIPQTVSCEPELTIRRFAEKTSLPEYPEETEPGSSQGVVFAAALFGTDGKLSKIKFYETPSPQASQAVKRALEKWKLKEVFDGGLQPTIRRTGIRFHFVFEDGKGRVEEATHEEQVEFGGQWGKRVCHSSFDE